MSLYAAGRTTGLVTDSGDGVSHTVPVFDGYSIPHAIFRMDIAGRRLTSYVQKLMQEVAGENLTSSSELEVVKNIKETLCFVSDKLETYTNNCNEADSSSTHDQAYTMPDKRVINVPGKVRFGGPELLFQPNLDGLTCDGLQKITHKSIMDSDVDVRKDLCKNIILSGGSTMFNGIQDRLKHELEGLLPPGSDVRIVAEPTRKFSVWRGASTLSSLSSFEESWVSKADYEEHGFNVVQRKCS